MFNGKTFKGKKAQTSMEYIMIAGGAILFVVVVILILRGGVLSETPAKIRTDLDKYKDKYLGTYLLFDNFDAGLSRKWTPDSPAAWTVVDGVYTSAADAPHTSLSRFIFSNFTFEVKMRQDPVGNGGGVGIVFRKNDLHRYEVLVDDGLVHFMKDGVSLHNYAAPANEWIMVKLKAKGLDFTITVTTSAGTSEESFTDSDNYAGKFGFVTYSDKGEFDDLRVWQE